VCYSYASIKSSKSTFIVTFKYTELQIICSFANRAKKLQSVGVRSRLTEWANTRQRTNRRLAADPGININSRHKLTSGRCDMRGVNSSSGFHLRSIAANHSQLWNASRKIRRDGRASGRRCEHRGQLDRTRRNSNTRRHRHKSSYHTH